MSKGLGLAISLCCLLGASCGTTNLNPPTPRALTGYVDFYTDSDLGLSWEVKRRNQTTGEIQTAFSEYAPVGGTILRLSAPPGRYEFEVYINNLVTKGPETVSVALLEGKVTPVHITLTTSGSTSINRKVYGFRPSYKGYGRGTKIVSEPSEVLEIGAIAEAPRAYQPKEQMPYFAGAH